MAKLIEFEELIPLSERVATEQAKQPPSSRNLCEAARMFWHWCREQQTRLDGTPSLGVVRELKLALLDRYFQWRVRVPDSCLRCFDEEDHVCIFQIFVEAYHNLDRIEVSIHPKPIGEEQAPPQVAIPGLMIGERRYEPHRPT